MGVEGEEPSEGEVAEVRAAVTRRVEEGAGEVDQEMLARVATDTTFLAQFWLHVFELPGPQVSLVSGPHDPLAGGGGGHHDHEHGQVAQGVRGRRGGLDLSTPYYRI